jgi:hypothetical protein
MVRADAEPEVGRERDEQATEQPERAGEVRGYQTQLAAGRDRWPVVAHGLRRRDDLSEHHHRAVPPRNGAQLGEVLGVDPARVRRLHLDGGRDVEVQPIGQFGASLSPGEADTHGRACRQVCGEVRSSVPRDV